MCPWKRAAAVLVLALHVACGGGGGGGGDITPPPPQTKAPNIVFILTDDQDQASLATMTRTLALIGDQGLRFERHFVSLSLCCPSRITGLRGQYAHNTGVFRNGPPDGGFEGVYAKDLEASTAATWLRGAGYRTALFGKYLNGYPDTAPSTTYIPPGWDEWYSPIEGNPYRQFNYTLNENGHAVTYGATASDYLTDVIARKATDFITRSVAEHPDQPFFAYVATYAPHAPAVPAPRHANAYPGLTAPHTASWDEADVSDKPSWVQALPHLGPTQIDKIDRLYRARLQTLLAVDELVEQLVATLQSTGQLDNTFIFFTSDNGYHLGQHRFEPGKMTAYEEDLRVPLMVRGPGVPKGSVSQLTSNVDYAPTFAALAGVSAPSFVDGRSLQALLQGKTPRPWRQVLLLEHKPDATDPLLTPPASGLREPADLFDLSLAGVTMDITAFSGLRTADGLTFVEYSTGEHELYDRATDPDQLDNAWSRTATDLQQRLSTLLSRLVTASGAALRQIEETAP